jgi:multidrug efflux pump subunit AcrA (membrane-fusion protein)
MNVLKRNVLAATLLSTALMASAVWAQEVSVDGKDFLSGAGDAKLADLARQAASQGKHLVVTAPNYWQSKVAAKLHAGAANVDVQMKEGFFENVLVRIEDGRAKVDTAAADAKSAAAKVEAQKAEAARAEAGRLESARAQAERQEAARQDAAKAESARAEAARQEAARQEAARAEAAKAETARQEAAKTAAAAAAKAKAEKDAAEKLTAQKKTMLQNLNGGRDADGTINAGQLQKDDQVFVEGQFRGVVRRGGARSQFFWLDGDLNLDRVELLPLGDNHYKVTESIRDNAPVVLRTKSVAGHIAATVPTADAADRKSLEQQYAEGKSVTETLRPADLRSGDVVYTAKSSAIVVRLQGTSYLRYWLDGDLNFGQTGLQKQGANAYRVISDTIH